MGEKLGRIMDRVVTLWSREPLGVIYVLASVAFIAYQGILEGVGVEEIMQLMMAGALTALARWQVWSPESVEELKQEYRNAQRITDFDKDA